MTQSNADRLKVLEQLESGELDFDQALSELKGAAQADGTSSSPGAISPSPGGTSSSPSATSSSAGETPSSSTATRIWGRWWLLPFYLGVLALGLGIVVANLGSWWWLLAVPLLLSGALLTILALASRRSPWLHVRVTNPARAWPKTIGISLPVPTRFAAWAVRAIGPFIPNLDEQAIAEMLILGGMMDEPLHVEIDDGDSGERIEIFLG